MRFTLIHGALHGAWCWERLIPELEALEHEAVAMDLPGNGDRHEEMPTLSGYRDAVLGVLQPSDVLVGHSMGSIVATIAADAMPMSVRHVVYLSGPLPTDGKPIAWDMGGRRNEDGSAEIEGTSKFRDGPDRYLRISDDGQYFVADFDGAVNGFYHDCDKDVAVRAFQRLTPQHIDIIVAEPVQCPRGLPAQIPRSFIRCTQDRIYPPRMSNRTIKQLGVTPIDIVSSHSPFLSRPAELARLIVEAVSSQS